MTQSPAARFYRPERAQGRFDAITIGSGMGGLAAAALLARAGKRVLVLERHYAMGGFTHTFRRRQYEWDVGVHYVGEFHQEGSLPNLLMNDISGSRLRWAPMPANYDRIVFPDRSYDLWAGRQRFIEELAAIFPAERRALALYVERVDAVYAAAMRFFKHKALPPLLASFAWPFLCRKFVRWASQTTAAALRTLTRDERLIAVLAGQWGTYGLPPAASSFGIHGIVPVGGAASIAESILPTIEASGGRLLTKAQVDEVLIRGGRVRGVRLVGGQDVRAPVVISDAGVVNTFGKLVDATTRRRLGLEARLSGLRSSTAHVCLYVGLCESAETLGLRSTNLWIHPSYDHDRNVRRAVEAPDGPLPMAYISFPSAKDPEWRERRGDCATVEVVSFVPYERFAAWEETPWLNRGEEYDELKARLSESLLKVLYEHVPQTRGKVDHLELSTPLSTKHFGAWTRGEIYGLDLGPDRFAIRWLGPRTPVRGLYLTGQDIVAQGVVGALFGGLVSASAILGRDLLRDIRRRAGDQPGP
jgi:all-trans-retinol 13,14-reductase